MGRKEAIKYWHDKRVGSFGRKEFKDEVGTNHLLWRRNSFGFWIRSKIRQIIAAVNCNYSVVAYPEINLGG